MKAVFEEKALPVVTTVGLSLGALSLLAYGGSKIIQPHVRSVEKGGDGLNLASSGFAYDAKQDIFYSEKKSWQRKFGYLQAYDEAAPFMNCIFHSEPIRFEYEGKKWLIELWKGQYGMATGCEIGVYTKEIGNLLPGYKAAKQQDHLFLTATLVKNGKVLFTRADTHWWLTGFVLGEYSEPEELSAYVRITLKTSAMCDVFVEELERLGYQNYQVLRDRKTVAFVFDVPYSKQPVMHSGIVRNWIMGINRNYCDLYQASGIEIGHYLKENEELPTELFPYGSTPFGGAPDWSGCC